MSDLTQAEDLPDLTQAEKEAIETIASSLQKVVTRIPWDSAVFCPTCKIVSDAVTHNCPECGTTELVNVARMKQLKERKTMEQNQAKFEGWAVVSLFGHQKEAGYVTTEYYGGPAMFRIDVPELPEREWILERPQRGDNYELLPVGTRVKREFVASRSAIVGVTAIYRMDPCTEDLVRASIEKGLSRPLIVVEMPKSAQLTSGQAESSHPEDCDCEECSYEDEKREMPI